MEQNRHKQIIEALNKKNVDKPCPRCSSNNFSVVGESEISITQEIPASGGLMGLGNPFTKKTTMPTIIITCDNCGYVAQHAQAALNLPTRDPIFGLRGLKRS